MDAINPMGRLARLARDQKAILVPMGGVGFVDFNHKPAIGTGGLGGCSVVILASQYGAILAHIPPRLDLTSNDDPYAGDRNVRRMMGLVTQEHDKYKPLGWFPDNDTVLVCAWFQGELALRDQVEIMYEALEALGYKPNIQTYHVPGDQSSPGQGTVHVDSETRKTNGKPTIYVEDEPVHL